MGIVKISEKQAHSVNVLSALYHVAGLMATIWKELEEDVPSEDVPTFRATFEASLVAFQSDLATLQNKYVEVPNDSED